MKRLPTEVKPQNIVPSDTVSGFDAGFGLSVHIPPEWREKFREEISRLIFGKKKTNVLAALTDEYGFLALNLTLTREQLQEAGAIDLGEHENTSPLLWHIDGDQNVHPRFSVLCSSERPPKRLSTTVIATAGDIFPVLAFEVDRILQKLKEAAAPQAFIRSWQEIREMLTPKSDRDQKMFDVPSIKKTLRTLLKHLSDAIYGGYLDLEDYRRLLKQPVQQLGAKVYEHEWSVPQTLIIANTNSVVHGRKPIEQLEHKGGKLYAIPVTG